MVLTRSLDPRANMGKVVNRKSQEGLSYINNQRIVALEQEMLMHEMMKSYIKKERKKMKQHCHGNSLHDQYLYERGDNYNAKKKKKKFLLFNP